MNLTKIKKAYFVGLKGIGMIALAQIFKNMGIEIIGSDEGDDFSNQVLDKLKINVIGRFDKKNIPSDIDLAVSSAAYYNPQKKSQTNPEVREIIKRKIPLLTYAQALAMIFEKKYGIAVAGSHGKSTTTAMLGLILEAAGLDPTVVVGARVAQWQSNARAGASKYLVAEADEYRDNFLNYWPKALVLTNVDYDHPDFFKDFEDYKKSFKKLVGRISKDGFIVAGRDKQLDKLLLGAKCQVIRYGLARPKINLKIPGRHNQLNAAAARAVALRLGIKETIIRKALADYAGISRRFEFKKKIKGVSFIDDYAHHPNEIKAVLQAARDAYPENRIWAVFQPHTFSRTKALLNDFAKSFGRADEVIVLDIYKSAREKSGDVHARDLVKLIKKYKGEKVQYISTIGQAADFLKKHSRAGDIVLTIGAGDVWELSTIADF